MTTDVPTLDQFGWDRIAAIGYEKKATVRSRNTLSA